MANELKMVFQASTTAVCSVTAAIASSAIAGGTTILDNSSALMPHAVATFNNPDSFAAAPNDRSSVDLYMVRQDVDGTDDDTSTPTSSDIEAAEYVGSFLIYDTDEEQRNTITISLAGVTKAAYYIYNRSGEEISYSTNPITVKITPFTFGT